MEPVKVSEFFPDRSLQTLHSPHDLVAHTFVQQCPETRCATSSKIKAT